MRGVFISVFKAQLKERPSDEFQSFCYTKIVSVFQDDSSLSNNISANFLSQTQSVPFFPELKEFTLPIARIHLNSLRDNADYYLVFGFHWLKKKHFKRTQHGNWNLGGGFGSCLCIR